MKQIFIVCSFFAAIAANAQTAFEKGNFVTKNDQQTECLIKNHDWNNIPAEIDYKLDESGEVKTIYTSQLKSFYINGTSHMYKEYDVPVIPIQKGNLIIKPGKQLLKVIAEGKASLLKNSDDIYFLHFEGQPVKPLIYSRFINTSTAKEETDNSFRLELYNSLKCETIGDLRKTKYDEQQLLKVIKRYNDCQDSETVNYAENKTKADFNLKLVAGLNSYTTNVTMMFVLNTGLPDGKHDDEVTVEGESGNNFTAGFEAEVRLPFNHKKWALFVAPTFNKQKGLNQHFTQTFRQFNATFHYAGTVMLPDFSYIEVPVGLKHYFILGKNSELNLNASYGASVYIGTKPEVVFKKDGGTLIKRDEVKSGFSILRIGAGYSFKNYSVGINYYARKSFSQSNSNGSISVLFGYKIF